MGSATLTETVKIPGLLFFQREEWEVLATMFPERKKSHFKRFGYPTLTIAGQEYEYYLATINGICYKCVNGSRPLEATEEL